MLTVEESVVIGRPRKEVWDYLTHPAHFTVWMSNLVEFDADWEREPAVGDTYRVVEKVAGRRTKGSAEVTDVVPGEMYAVRSIEAPFPVENAYRLEDADESTRLTFHGETPGMPGLVGKLTNRIMVRMFARSMRSNLKKLRGILEGN